LGIQDQHIDYPIVSFSLYNIIIDFIMNYVTNMNNKKNTYATINIDDIRIVFQ
jgi:hypothetical protein